MIIALSMAKELFFSLELQSAFQKLSPKGIGALKAWEKAGNKHASRSVSKSCAQQEKKKRLSALFSITTH